MGRRKSEYVGQVDRLWVFARWSNRRGEEGSEYGAQKGLTAYDMAPIGFRSLLEGLIRVCLDFGSGRTEGFIEEIRVNG